MTRDWGFEDIASKELWFRTGVKDRLRFLHVYDVCQNLSNRVLKPLPAFHALTSCDTTSALSGIGKKKPWNVFIRSAVHQESLTVLGQQPEVDEETAKNVKHLYATSIPHTKKVRRLMMSSDTLSFVKKKSLTVRLYNQSLTACDKTSTVQTTRRTFGEKASMPYSSSHPPKDAGGKKKMMSWRQSWCPRTRHLPAYWSLRRVPARRQNAAATVWRRTRVRTYMEWNGSWGTVIPMTRSEHVQNVHSCSLLRFGTGCWCTIWSVAL